jgi:outer membrane protein assembly factor BamA
VTYDRFVDRGPTDASFNRWEADLRQYIPVFGTTRTIALRGYIVNLVPDAGHVVPFYLQPTLGGPDSLRGLRAYRLRDRSLMLLQSEYRWDVNAFFGGVLFYEAGTVASRLEDLSLGDVIKDYGGGVRFGFRGTVSLRIEVAFGSPDGTRLVFRFSDVF